MKEGDLCIDATAGNGNDTLFLCELVGECGRVLAFDIQKRSGGKYEKADFGTSDGKTCRCFSGSHAKMQKYAKEETVDCIVFNFGYLPGGDHQLATKADTSMRGNQTGTATAEGGRHDESLHLQRRGQRI